MLNSKIISRQASSLSQAVVCSFSNVNNSKDRTHSMFDFLRRSKKDVKLLFEPTKFNQDVTAKLETLHEGYNPPLYLSHHFAQSLYNSYGPKFRINYHREYVKMDDGGQVALDWALPLKKHSYDNTPFKDIKIQYEPPKDNKILFAIHGLTGGGSESIHVKYLVRYAQTQGYRVVVFNNRGYNQQLTSPLPVHGGKLDDMENALDLIKDRYPQAKVYACGISFGGNQLLRLLGSEGNSSRFEAAAAMGSPFDLEQVLKHMEGTIYERSLLKKFISENMLPSIELLESLKETHRIDFTDVLNSKSLYEFHSKFTAKSYKHNSVEEFFEASKVTHTILQNIKIPTLCVHSRDDPIVNIDTVPVQSLKTNKNIIYAETARGSHICWLEGRSKPQSWYPRPACEFFNVIEQKGKE